MSGVDTEVLKDSYIEDNTSQGKNWIFDSGSAIHVCSHKEMFNFLVTKEEGTVKMVDGSAYEVISKPSSSALGQSMLHTEMG